MKQHGPKKVTLQPKTSSILTGIVDDDFPDNLTLVIDTTVLAYVKAVLSILY